MYIKLKLWVCIFVFICMFLYSLIAREGINRFAPNLVYLFLETRKRIQEGQNSGKMSRVRFPVRAVPLARKISTIEERRQDQSCFFRRGDYKNKGYNPDISWVLFPAKMVSVARKLITTEERRQDRSCPFQQ
jgi:hypothetical protein